MAVQPQSPYWEQLLERVMAAPELGDGVAELLAAPDDVSLPLAVDEASEAFEPYMSLLRVYQRLDRALSEVLYRRAYNEEPPLLGSDFGDWAVGSLAREAYLDLRLAATAFVSGLDLQAMCLLRQMAELLWRALIVVGDPHVADEWWESVVASAETGERARIEKRLWSRHFRPAQQIERVGEIEARLDGLSAEAAEDHERKAIVTLSGIYSLLSGTTHGGSDLVYASVTRGTGRLSEDPFERLGVPNELGETAVRASLHLQWRFWHYFPRAAFAEATPPDTGLGALLRAAPALNDLLLRHYGEHMRGDEAG